MKVTYILAATTCVAILAVGAMGYHAWRYRSAAIEAQDRRDELITRVATLSAEPASSEVFRTLLRHNAGILKSDAPIVIAKKLTDHLHHATSFADPIATTSNDALRYTQTISREIGNLCSSLSSTLVWSLDQFGIKSRSVNLYSQGAIDGSAPGDGHVFVEADINGVATVLDPTFGATYACGSNNDISATQVFNCKSDVRPIYISRPQTGRSLEEYYIPLSELLTLVTAPALDGLPPLNLNSQSP